MDKPPAAPMREARDSYFGKEIVDPYRWMETDSPEFQAWMKAQSEYTRGKLDGLAGREALRKRIADLDNAGARVSNVQRWAGKIFSLEAEPGADNFKFYVRDSSTSKKRLLLDPEDLSKDGAHVSIECYQPSPDARYVAYCLSPSGSEMSVIHVIETATGKPLADVIDRARLPSLSWLDDRSFFYKRDRKLPPDTPSTERFTKARVHLHVLGADPEKDEQVFGFGLSPDVDIPEDAFPAVFSPVSSRYVFATLEHGVQPEMSLYYAPKKSIRGGKTPWKRLASPKDGVTSFDVRGEDLYLVTHLGAPRGKLVRATLGKPDLAKAIVVMPEGEAVITGTNASKDALYVRKLDGGIGRLFRVPFDKPVPEPVDLGVEGSVRGFFGEDSTPGALVRLEAWTASPRP
jgi:prolyl oligopeptidase